jgi:hypothetical protein
MNVHDSERLSGLLERAGYARAEASGQADVVVLNTCAVRENADNKLYGNLGHLASVKAVTPGMQIAVGGCLAQKDRSEITRRAPWVDVVFGTHNIASLPALLDRARIEQEAPAVPGIARLRRFGLARVSVSPEKPHGLDYSLTLHGPDGVRLVGFDNAHPVAKQKRGDPQDHRHRLRTLRSPCARRPRCRARGSRTARRCSRRWRPSRRSRRTRA